MATMTFLVNDASTSSGYPKVWVTVSENLDGTLLVKVSQEGGIIGDLRGVFFDIADESLLNSMIITATNGSPAPTEVIVGDDSVKDLGSGANMDGLVKKDAFDVGVEIGSSGIAKGDDYQTYEFLLDSSLRDLTLNDFTNVDFGVRLTSVGTIGGARADSSKIMETTFDAVNAVDDVFDCVEEDTSQVMDILANDRSTVNAADQGNLSLLSWSASTAGQLLDATSGNPIAANAPLLFNTAYHLNLGLDAHNNPVVAIIQVDALGHVSVNAINADALSADEHFSFEFNYTVKSANEGTNFSTDEGKFTIEVCGVNDAPLAVDDNFVSEQYRILEGHTGSMNVLANAVNGNDSDVDLLDTISVVAVAGIRDGEAGDLDAAAGAIKVLLASGAMVTMDLATGLFTYDTQAAFDHLNDGEMAMDTFAYTISDNHGAEAFADVTVCIDGENDASPPPPPDIDFPSFEKNSLSNIVFYLDNDDDLSNNLADGVSTLVKLKYQADTSGITDLNAIDFEGWIAENAGDLLSGHNVIVAFSIHGGLEMPNTWDSTVGLELQPGEGVLFLNKDPLETVINQADSDTKGDLQAELADGSVVLHDSNNFTAFHAYVNAIGITDNLLQSGNYTPLNGV